MFVFRRGFQVGFWALFAFRVYVSGVSFDLSLRFGLGFCWLFSICWFQLGLLIFLSFSGFSDLGFAYIFAHFFWFFCSFFFFFCCSLLVIDGFWS